MNLDLSDLPGVEVSKPKASLNGSTWLFYGLPGSGKTTLAASAVEIPELGPVLYLDFENSTAAVAAKYGDHPNLDVIQIRDWPTAVRVLHKVLYTPHQYKTVVVDPINALMQLLQMHMNRRVETKRKLQLKDSLTPAEQKQMDALSGVKVMENTNNSLGESTTSLPDYLVIGTKTIEYVNALAAGPFLSILVTHADDRADEVTRQVVLRPDTPGNMGKKIIEEKPTVVGYLRQVTRKDDEGNETDNVVISFQNGKVGATPFRAKKRLGLPRGIVNPDMAQIWDIVNNAK